MDYSAPEKSEISDQFLSIFLRKENRADQCTNTSCSSDGMITQKQADNSTALVKWKAQQQVGREAEKESSSSGN